MNRLTKFKNKIIEKKNKNGLYALEAIIVSAALVAICAFLIIQFKGSVKTAGETTNKVMIESINPKVKDKDGGK